MNSIRFFLNLFLSQYVHVTLSVCGGDDVCGVGALVPEKMA